MALALAKPPPKRTASSSSNSKSAQGKEQFYDEYDGSYGSPVAQASVNHYDAYAHGGGGGKKTGYSAGSGLRSIAQGSADQANTAVANQHAAAKQAAYVAKNTLAQSAAQASATAQAALAGKQVILQGLEQQVRDAKVALDGESQQLITAQRAASTAAGSAQQAAHQVKTSFKK